MPALTVADALARVLDGAVPGSIERVDVAAVRGRTLAGGLSARLTQPPFTASAMDGYAVRAVDVADLPATLAVIGEAAAGHPFHGTVAAGQAARIFTGAPLPAGSDAVVIQENCTSDGATVVVRDGQLDPEHVRRRGFDFREGDILLQAGRVLGAREMALAGAMGHGALSVRRRPRVAIIATGDELVLPGETPGAAQIVCSNHLAVAALAEAAGAETRFLGIARDRRDDIARHIAMAADADLLVTIGGASVGDHDLVGPVLADTGMALDFWKIAMRPGKPLMFGRRGAQRVVGLPGNSVSAIVCARVFLVPLIHALLGHSVAAEATRAVATTVALPANGPRTHYMRASTSIGGDGIARVTPVRSQDSSLLSTLAEADCLIVRPIDAPVVAAGETVPVMQLAM